MLVFCTVSFAGTTDAGFLHSLYTGSVSNINPIGDAPTVIVLAITLAILLALMAQVSL